MLFKARTILSTQDLQNKINQLHVYYLPMNLNPSYERLKVSAMNKIEQILHESTRKNLQEVDFEELLLCVLTILYFFGMRLKINNLKSRNWNWCLKRNFIRAETVFQDTINNLSPERSEITTKITFKFLSNIDLWQFESFVVQILEVILYYNNGQTTIFNLMLSDIQSTLFSDVKSARHRIRVLYDLLKSENWIIEKQYLLPFVSRLLELFSYSIEKNDLKLSAYGFLRKGFEVCLRRIFERVENHHRIFIITTMLNWFSVVNLNSDHVLEFSSLLDRAAELYTVESYTESFGEGVFEQVLVNFVASRNTLHSFIGCRLLQRFLDRQRNAALLMVPTIYYEFSQAQLRLGSYESCDKTFFRHYRDKIHEHCLVAVKMHCHNISNLKVIFAIICSIVLEVPCGLTAAMAACLCMEIQDYALNEENLVASSRYWMHAIVISVMSLICWVHKASVLYRYVNQVISRRAKEAPHLNPPLMQSYKIGHGHVTWNKPTLFFEDWEMRFGLWKHFKDAQPITGNKA